MPSSSPKMLGVGDVLRLEDRDEDADHDRADEGEDRDRRVLAADERDRALEDGRRDVLHLLRARCRAAGRPGPGRARRRRRCSPAGRMMSWSWSGVHRAGSARPPCQARPSARARSLAPGTMGSCCAWARRPLLAAGRRGGSGRGGVYQPAGGRVKPRIPRRLCTDAHARGAPAAPAGAWDARAGAGAPILPVL